MELHVVSGFQQRTLPPAYPRGNPEERAALGAAVDLSSTIGTACDNDSSCQLHRHNRAAAAEGRGSPGVSLPSAGGVMVTGCVNRTRKIHLPTSSGFKVCVCVCADGGCLDKIIIQKNH